MGEADGIEKYRSKKRRKQRIILTVGIVIIVIVIAYFALSQPLTFPLRTPDSLSDVPQLTAAQTLALHIHLHLDIYLNSTHVLISNNLGHLSSGLLYAIHTHDFDPTGIIHVESPTLRDYTLGEIFEVWGWPLDGGHIFDRTGPVTLYVNNGVTPTQFDANYILHSHDEIVLVYGNPPSEIPSSYSFPTGETP